MSREERRVEAELPGRAVRRPGRRLPVAAVAFWLGAATAATALPPERPVRDPFDLEVEAWLAGLPEDEVEGALRDLLAEGGAITSFHAVSPPSQFARNSPEEAFLFFRESGAIETLAYLAPPCYYAALRLPHGATVTGLVIHLVDNEASNLSAALHRKAVGSLDLAEVMATTTSSGATAGVRVFTDLTVDHALVDNDSFYYYSELCLPHLSAELRGVYVAFSR